MNINLEITTLVQRKFTKAIRTLTLLQNILAEFIRDSREIDIEIKKCQDKEIKK